MPAYVHVHSRLDLASSSSWKSSAIDVTITFIALCGPIAFVASSSGNEHQP